MCLGHHLVLDNASVVLVGEHLRPHFNALRTVVAAGLIDAAPRVRRAALASLAALVQWVGDAPEVKLFRELIPSVLEVQLPALDLSDKLSQGLSGSWWLE